MLFRSFEMLRFRRGRREAEMSFVRGESEQEPGFHKERHSPFDRLVGLGRDALEDRVQRRKCGWPSRGAAWIY